ncbi:MAG: N utilization substance protein B-like protein [Candidatus Curtissbacteria bacterium GW2011_GWA1_40_24]|uniref:N utilization substance protein B-like protein n=1 Tax=Candidatus Curtissbacteria bacterium GW2011_GWA1_40_24 TaxID=1618406 RepID=A0A0G0U5G3_9BACT|nr:MAG: N utilization substance protein B-like protein [Candidatus Curtissbacteria bacterium GW2011_GWA1_40_24]
MKKKADPRHKLRVETVKKLFEQSFRKNIDFDKGSEAEKISASQKKIDTLVEKFAPSWPIEQILPMDLAILRLSIWELAFKEKKEPYKVIVDGGYHKNLS